MSSTEPPSGSVPPDPTTPPASSAPPPPPPPPPAPGYGAAPQYGAPPPAPAGAYGAPQGTGMPRPGGVLERFLARLIDFIVVGIVSAIIGVVLGAISDSYLLSSLIASIVDAALFLGYFAFLESNSGQTLGKMALKLKTFGPDGQSVPTMEQAVRRNIWTAFGLLGVVPVLGSIVGGLAALVAEIMIAVGISNDPRGQAWHDRFAGGTQVMKIG